MLEKADPTTLLQQTFRTLCCPCLFGVLFQVGDSLTYGSNRLSLFVRNGDIEFFLEFHDQFNGVQRVCTQIISKEASLVTSASSTPSLSTIIFLTLVAMSDIVVNF
jgi:hypothetical protein